MRRPRIFVDARFVTTAPASSHARYLRELVRQWSRSDFGPEFVLYTPGPRPSGLPNGPRVRWVSPARIVSRVGRRAHGGRVWLNSAFTLASLRARPDVLFFPYPFVPCVLGAPAVVTVHDVCFQSQPAAFADRGGNLSARARHALVRASEIIAVSETSRAGTIAAYGIDDERITVIHHGLDPIFRPRSSNPSEPYILCVSTHEPRKNLETLARAYVDLVRDNVPAKLVLVGQSTDYTSRLLAILSASPAARSATTLLNAVSDIELAELYQRAAVVANPSLCEGFGFPVLEALACGTPVLASDQPVFRELVGDAATYVAPLDVGAWTAELRRALIDPARHSAARAVAPSIAQRFTWQRSADATLAVLERVASGARTRSAPVPC